MRAVFALAFFAAACVSAPAPSTGSFNGEWTLISEAAQPPTLSFEGDRASGFAGCNRWFAQATRDGDALRFGGIGATRMMCPPPRMEIETAFLGALERTRGARIQADTLTLIDESGAVVATLRR